MARLVGFLFGIGLAAALVFALLRYTASGTPDGTAPVPDPVGRAVTAPDPNPDPDPDPAASGEQTVVQQVPADTGTPMPPPDRADDPAPAAEPVRAGQTPVPQETAPAETPRWYAFWQPFHSEISAAGFRERLERVTGLDYRIVSPRPGEYQVAFAYRDEAERQAHLAAIEAATGLVLRNTVL